MINIIRNRKKAKTGFKKKAWIQSLKNIQKSSIILDTISIKKIKNKLDSFKQK